jgi:hypothetical protein
MNQINPIKERKFPMNIKQFINYPKQHLSITILKSKRKEANMSTKGSFKILLAVGLLMVIVLSALIVTTTSAPAASSVNSPINRPASYYKGSDWIERHPNVDVPVNRYSVPTPLPPNYYTGSDWIERHPELDVPVNQYIVPTPLR